MDEKSKSKPGDLPVIYNIIVGSFKLKENAEKRVSYLDPLGIDSYVHTVHISNEPTYRVQAGAYSNRDGAEKRLEEVKKAGLTDAFIFSENVEAVNLNENESIMGPIILLPKQMDQFVIKVNSTSMQLANFYVNFGKYYGIRGDIAFAQAILETDYFRFTGVVQPHQNNFCGLGSTGPDNPGASFDTSQDGVLAHLQHLFAYAETKPLPEKYPLLDPRFQLVRRGVSPTWVELNGKWAVPGDQYGQTILNIYQRMTESNP
jgi:N-acetylmuramoyl-L-alanine amidase